MSRRSSLFLAAFLALWLGGLPALAQTTGSGEIEITEVNIGRYPRVQMVVEFRNLQQFDQEQLVVTEGGEPVADFEIEPISESVVQVGIVLVIDRSGSMQNGPIEAAQQAAISFVRQKRAQDFIAIVTFGDDVQVLSGFSNSIPDLEARIDSIEAEGGTALYDGVVRAAQLFTGSASVLEPNAIVLSDGVDTTSSSSLQEAIAAVDAQGVRVFGVGLESEDFDPIPIQDIVNATNGLYLSTTNPDELTNLYDQIKRELDNKVVVRFTASETQRTDVEFGVEYAGLTATSSLEVPGFVPTTRPAPTTTVTFPSPTPYTIESQLPASPLTLRILAGVATGITTLLLLVVLFGNRSDPESEGLGGRLRAYGRGPADPRGEESPRGLLARLPFLRRLSEQAEEVAKRRGVLSGVNAALEQGNIPLRPGEAIAAAIGLAAVGGGLTGLLLSSAAVGLIIFVVLVLLVVFLVQLAGRQEKKKFEDQLPDTLTLISTSLRAGYSLLQAVEAVAAEAPNPTAREFGRAIAETRLGRPVVQSLEGIAERMRSDDFTWAVMAIEIQREVGGNLAEVLQTVANTMLARNRLRGEIKALTAEGRISAFVLIATPFVLFAYLYSTNRDYLEPMLDRTIGQLAMGAGLLLMVAGAFWLRKIVDIEV